MFCCELSSSIDVFVMSIVMSIVLSICAQKHSITSSLISISLSKVYYKFQALTVYKFIKYISNITFKNPDSNFPFLSEKEKRPSWTTDHVHSYHIVL